MEESQIESIGKSLDEPHQVESPEKNLKRNSGRNLRTKNPKKNPQTSPWRNSGTILEGICVRIPEDNPKRITGESMEGIFEENRRNLQRNSGRNLQRIF